jgi:hypothetical protein
VISGSLFSLGGLVLVVVVTATRPAANVTSVDYSFKNILASSVRKLKWKGSEAVFLVVCDPSTNEL